MAMLFWFSHYESCFRHQCLGFCCAYAEWCEFPLLSMIPSPDFQLCLSLGLYSEWQAVLTRAEHLPNGISAGEALRYLGYLAGQSHLQEIHFLWRPFLTDPDDDMVLELAFAVGCDYIITHNTRDFRETEALGVKAVTPGEFLQILRSRS